MNRKSYDIKFFQALAKEKGGTCLSKEYTRSRDKLKWKCENGHIFELAPRVIFNKKWWCPACFPRKNRRHTIESLKKDAENIGWKLLSSEYKGGNVKHNFMCDRGHEKEMTPEQFLRKPICTVCSGKPPLLTITIFKKIAIERGGRCLSKKYEGQKRKLDFVCGKGHQFSSNPSSVKDKNTWCPKCNSAPKGTIEEMREIAKWRGGRCLSIEYNGSGKKLEWQCKENHPSWLARPRDIKHKSWCPHCKNKQETKCRYIFEKLLGTNFQKTRKILGNRLELDGYSEKERLAFEYNGVQHYEQGRLLTNTLKKLDEIKKRDEEKVEVCKKKGIELIVIPFKEANSEQNLIEFIKAELTKRKKTFKNFTHKNLMQDFYKTHSVLDEIKKLVESKGGHLLSNIYENTDTKLKVKCVENHIWETSNHKLRSGYWCKKCYGNEKLTIEEMHEIAKINKGKCLSKVYINNTTPLLWECEFGHQWSAQPDNVKQGGTWCPDCSGKKKRTIEEMHEIAKSKEGECLSNEYINNTTKLKWKCEKGHIWSAPAKNIQTYWCLECSKELKKQKDR